MSGGYYHRNQYWSNNNQRIRKSSTSSSMFDYLKVFMLLLIYCVLLFNAAQKYFYTSGAVNFTLAPNYQYCNDVCKNETKDVLDECKKQEDAAYADDISERCKPYITSLTACLKATKEIKKCGTEVGNLEGCTGKIVKAVVDKWWADHTKQPTDNGGTDKRSSNLKKTA